MATEAQIEANRANAQSSTGPRTEGGKARSSRNAFKFGLFSSKNCVQTGEEEEYATLSGALWEDLAPQGPVQQLIAAEIIRAAWRLERCAKVEAVLGEAMELRSPEDDPLDPMADRSNLGATQATVDRARAQATSALNKGLTQLSRLKAEQKAAAEPDPVAKRSAQPVRAEAAPAIRTQSPSANFPRNASCPCGSGQKYKRCCGRNAPALLSRAA